MWRDDALLLDMLLWVKKVRSFNAGVSADEFVTDELRQSATLHALQVVGEAASKVSVDFQQAHPEIEWAKIIGLRHRLVHDYGRIDLSKIWEIVDQHVPPLIGILEPLIPPDTQD